jgi:hypothetical protein
MMPVMTRDLIKERISFFIYVSTKLELGKGTRNDYPPTILRCLKDHCDKVTDQNEQGGADEELHIRVEALTQQFTRAFCLLVGILHSREAGLPFLRRGPKEFCAGVQEHIIVAKRPQEPNACQRDTGPEQTVAELDCGLPAKDQTNQRHNCGGNRGEEKYPYQ